MTVFPYSFPAEVFSLDLPDKRRRSGGSPTRSHLRSPLSCRPYVTLDAYAQANRDMEYLFMEKNLAFPIFLARFTQLASDCRWSAARRVEGLRTKVSRNLTINLVAVLNCTRDNEGIWSSLPDAQACCARTICPPYSSLLTHP
jgi:hypothetical protein